MYLFFPCRNLRTYARAIFTRYTTRVSELMAFARNRLHYYTRNRKLFRRKEQFFLKVTRPCVVQRAAALALTTEQPFFLRRAAV